MNAYSCFFQPCNFCWHQHLKIDAFLLIR
jgi:hypothetical protein